MSRNNLPLLERWDNLPGSALAMRLCEIKRHERFAIVAQSSLKARQLAKEIALFSKNRLSVCVFPTWEILPYDQFSPHHDIISERLHTLYQLVQNPPDIVILTPESLLMRVVDKPFIIKTVTHFKRGQSLSIKTLTQMWQQIGYERTNRVEEHSQYALRGSIIDIFPIGSKKPYRIDLFDDEIDSIRVFDPHTQLTTQQVQEIDILPANEFIADDIQQDKIHQRAALLDNCAVAPQLLSEKRFPGIEFFLPLLHDKLVFIGDYLEGYQFLAPSDLMDFLQSESDLIDKRYQQFKNIRHCLAPSALWLSPADIKENNLSWQYYDQSDQKRAYKPRFQNFEAAKQLLSGYRTFIFSSSKSHELELIDQLQKANQSFALTTSLTDALHSDASWTICPGQLSNSFILANVQMAFLCETNLLAKQPAQRPAAKHDSDDWHSFHELKIGDYCTHPDHGIGQFITIEKFPKQNDEFLKLQFAKGACIFVNIQHANQIQPYISFGQAPVVLDELGSKKWQTRKQKALKNIEVIAAKLLAVAQKQKNIQRQPIKIDPAFTSFCNAFPFTETPDQIRATQAIVQDCASTYPINRLLMGDVGFGKTEIMQRAAFLQASASFKTIVIAPTTILATQHAERFIDRFSEFPIEIAHLSRNTTPKQTAAMIARFNDNKVDILIGTHKLFHAAIAAEKVGLIIIDEEHRFGVKQKEHFKDLFPEAHFLKVSATPIPRSLGMAFGQIMKLSILSTPPTNRHAIYTQVAAYSDTLILEAITREMHRGGQVYYVLNRIEDLENRAEHLKKIMPHVRFDMIHGRLHATQIQQTMVRFINQEFDVLLTTAIVESGIDVANANTLIIERADLFGISSLHQLRGRIGRSHHQAYAFLLKDPDGLASKDAQERLEALEAHQELGAGYFLANRDLEMRGAGEILGEKQSGHVNAIGYGTYVDLLQNELAIADHQTIVEKPEVKLTITGALPSHHIPDVNERLRLYQSLANCTDEREVEQMRKNLIDRFGALPEYTEHLFLAQILSLKAATWMINHISESEEGFLIRYSQEKFVPGKKLIALMQSKQAPIIPKGPKSFVIKKAEPTLAGLINFLSDIHS